MPIRKTMRRYPRHAGVALDESVLHFDGAAHRVDHAAEFDEAAVAGALDHATMMHCDGRIDQIAAQRPESRQDAILVRSREPAVADDIRDQNRRDLPGLAHGAPSGRHPEIAQERLEPRVYQSKSVATSNSRRPVIERRESTYCGRTRPRLWTPQLGGLQSFRAREQRRGPPSGKQVAVGRQNAVHRGRRSAKSRRQRNVYDANAAPLRALR
jgi:hypothetical protein